MSSQTAVQRDILRVWDVPPVRQNAIHTVGMVLEPGKFTEFDPFLLLAEDWFGHGTFDVHPHRGIETVTYVMSGKLNHYDNNFGDGELYPGDVQWMTAGRGVIHKEDPVEGEMVHSLQLWVNLPRGEKLTEPGYQKLRAKDMPVRSLDGGYIRVFSGKSGDAVAPTKNHVPVTMVEINLEAGASATQELPIDYRGFLYVLEGEGEFGTTKTVGKKAQALWLEDVDHPAVGSEASAISDSVVTVRAITPIKVLLYAGRPLHEPVVAYGPFVMNTREEIAQAFRDYQEGRFGE